MEAFLSWLRQVLLLALLSRCQAVTTMQKLGMQYIAAAVVETILIDQQGGANRSPSRAAT